VDSEQLVSWEKVQIVEACVTKHHPRKHFGEETRLWERKQNGTLFARNEQRAYDVYSERRRRSFM
jgi:hypothetical protein